MEETLRRTPWVTASPADLPEITDYGTRVLDLRPVSEKTKRDHAAAWRNRVAPSLEGLKLNQVAPEDIRLMVKSLSERYAPSTVRDTYGLVKYVFATAIADGLVITTPCVRISLPRRNKESEVQPAPPAAVRAIAELIDDRYQALVFVLAATGLRIGEALALRKDDVVEVPRLALRVERSLRDDASFGPTKSGRSRLVTLPPWSVEIIREQLGRTDSELLFPSPEGRPLPPRRFSSRYWRPAAKKAGWADVTPHRLRHLHVTQLLEMRRPLTEIAARLGHANPRVTAEVYAKWIQLDDSGAADATPDFSGVQERPIESRRVTEM
jgi:integrase